MNKHSTAALPYGSRPTPLTVGADPRQPPLTPDEQAALATLTVHYPGWVHAQPLLAALDRLVRPLYDALAGSDCRSWARHVAVRVVASDMHRRQTPYWTWNDANWAETIGVTTRAAQERHGTCASVRQYVAVLAYRLGNLHDLSPFFVARGLHWVVFAGSVFGAEALEVATTVVWTVAAGWGYCASARRDLRLALAIALLDNRSPHLADLTATSLATLRARAYTFTLAENLDLLSRVLAHQGVLAAPLPRRHTPHVPFPERPAPEGVPLAWLDWVYRWHRMAVGLSPKVRDHYALSLFRVGRWLAAVHPEVTSPEQWTYELAAACSEMVQALTVGQYCTLTDQRQYMGRYGQPLKSAAKVAVYTALRIFFNDLQAEPFNLRRRFDAVRAFRLPASIRRALGPDPREIDIRWWSMIVHAAVHLEAADLPASPSGQYPLELVRAVAIVWCYSALRSDEIRRLEMGCIRWQREDVTVAETGDVLPKDVVCFLTIPLNKTNTAFPKAVNPLVGQAINAWERVRPPDQPPLPDRKTGQLTDHLFRYRGRLIGTSYINDTVIPVLCAKAGLPTADERGAITSHRARSTIATALYNAPDGMTIWELMQWLGHRHPSSTQQYARANPTKLAVAYEKAERTSRLIEVLIDHQAGPAGAVKVYYVLGEEGLCGNAEWYSCAYRMACLKCPFFIPQDQAALIRSRDTVELFLKQVQLTPEELAAAEEDRDRLTETHTRTNGAPVPRTLHQRAKGSTVRGMPLPVLPSHRPEATGT